MSRRTAKKALRPARRKSKPGGVFLCHNSADKDAIKKIADALYLEFGTRYFLDAYAIPVGEAFIPWIEKALAMSSGCVIFLGANGWGPTHLWEAERAVARYREQPRFKLIPAALPGIKPRDMKRLGAGTIFQRINWADFSRRPDDRASLTKLHAALTGQSLPQDRGPALLTPYQIRRDAERWKLSKCVDVSILYQGEQLRDAERLLRENPDFVVVDEVISFLNAGSVRERTMADAAKFDAQAAGEFVQASRRMTQWDLENARQTELQAEIERRLAAGESLEAGRLASMRVGSLQGELAETRVAMDRLDSEARSALQRGRAALVTANDAWKRAGGDATSLRQTASVPKLFSVEVLSVGFGESFILHYGDIDDPRFILVDGGQPQKYEHTLKPRLEALRARWAPAGALPIEYVIVSNQDNDRIGGLERMFRDMVENRRRGSQPTLHIKNVWYESFSSDIPKWQKSLMRRHIEELGIPLNQPFDHLVMRPETGRVSIDFGKGLTATVLNPEAASLVHLHKLWREQAAKWNGSCSVMPQERFTNVSIAAGPPKRASIRDSGCQDKSVANRASLVVLFEFDGGGGGAGPYVSFLHPGDSCSTQVEAGLRSAGVSDDEARLNVNLMLVPHLGSRRNVTPEFFDRITADQYLFTGDGTFQNPSDETLELILEARRGDAPVGRKYTFQFVNRDGSGDLGERLDAFFARQPSERYGYRRVFRSSAKSNMIIDLLERVRY